MVMLLLCHLSYGLTATVPVQSLTRELWPSAL